MMRREPRYAGWGAGNDLGGGGSFERLDGEIWSAAGIVHGLEECVREGTASKELLAGKPALTQFGRMCERLGIRIVAASSPQAKGRVERNHGRHQDRLVKKLRRRKIGTHEAVNR